MSTGWIYLLVNPIVAGVREQGFPDITRILVKHAAKVYSELPEEEPLPKQNNRKKRFFESLPKEFSRKDFLTIAMRVGIPDRTTDRYIREFCKSGMLTSDPLGQFKLLSHEIWIANLED